MPLSSPDPDLAVVGDLPAGATHVDADRLLRDAGWTRCGTGDWAWALRSPDGRSVARISPFDPAAPYSAALYRSAATTGQVPLLLGHRVLEGGGDLTLMEHLEPVREAEAAAFHRSIAARMPDVAALAAHIAAVHARGAVEQPWWGPLDDNPANVMRGRDGRLVVTDLFYADGPDLYRTVLDDPDRVVRAYPEHLRRFMTELPLASSGSWAEGEAERMRAALAAADARLIGTDGR
ncbi:hypothetical protein EDF24_0852 [Curtobacterium sp. PhB130]|uniref:hypothetical protein n=1 Tax=unclassified Curtobacterium TaxID=257496 RepID=UPI000F4D257C|nr:MULTISPECIES: hypothetical protein [unclassified Curtobacterium]ROS78082.1 hypothetical protein EDF24_0852 [Curtobacterium sp. PhB130]TCK65601.1 hypothetical protein EDF27_0341 [Curtobacterium sp. PhB136]